jgi:hypothetical protein
MIVQCHSDAENIDNEHNTTLKEPITLILYCILDTQPECNKFNHYRQNYCIKTNFVKSHMALDINVVMEKFSFAGSNILDIANLNRCTILAYFMELPCHA